MVYNWFWYLGRNGQGMHARKPQWNFFFSFFFTLFGLIVHHFSIHKTVTWIQINSTYRCWSLYKRKIDKLLLQNLLSSLNNPPSTAKLYMDMNPRFQGETTAAYSHFGFVLRQIYTLTGLWLQLGIRSGKEDLFFKTIP